MPGVTFDQIVSDRRDVTCTWNGKSFKVWYRPSAFTPETEQAFHNHRRLQEDVSACATVLAPMLDGWEVYADEKAEKAGTPMPYDHEGLQSIPGPFLVKVLLHIAHDIAPDQAPDPDNPQAPKGKARPTTRQRGRNVGR